MIDPIPSVFQEQEPIPAREWHEQYARLASGRAVSFRPTAPLQPRIQVKKPESDRINRINRILWVFPKKVPNFLFLPLPAGGEGRGEGESFRFFRHPGPDPGSSPDRVGDPTCRNKEGNGPRKEKNAEIGAGRKLRPPERLFKVPIWNIKARKRFPDDFMFRSDNSRS